MAQVIGLRRNRVIQRLSERLPPSHIVAAAAVRYGLALGFGMFGMEDPQHTEGIGMDQVMDAMMPFFTLAIVLFGIETVFDMFWREHKKAKREREREKKREKRRLEYQDRRMANDAEHAKVTRAMRYDVLRRDGFHCVRCGRGCEDGVRLHVDHVVPVSRGGKSTMDNLQTLCEDCNCGKGNKYIE